MENKQGIVSSLKSNWQLILILILIIILFFQWRNTNELLEYKDEQTKKEIQKYEAKEREQQKQIDSLDGLIVETKTVINNITKEREVQIKYIDRYSNEDLSKYFEERYGK
jgi:peptidoglycan hydrolase CwlO-like protein